MPPYPCPVSVISTPVTKPLIRFAVPLAWEGGNGGGSMVMVGVPVYLPPLVMMVIQLTAWTNQALKAIT